MTRTTADILREARALIDTSEKWIKGHYKKDGCFCASGALFAVAPKSINYRGHMTARYALRRATPDGVGIIAYNDNPYTTHADMMALFDRAIADQEGEA